MLYNTDCLSDKAIVYWYQKGAKPQGKQHFLKATEPLVKVRFLPLSIPVLGRYCPGQGSAEQGCLLGPSLPGRGCTRLRTSRGRGGASLSPWPVLIPLVCVVPFPFFFLRPPSAVLFLPAGRASSLLRWDAAVAPPLALGARRA